MGKSSRHKQMLPMSPSRQALFSGKNWPPCILQVLPIFLGRIRERRSLLDKLLKKAFSDDKEAEHVSVGHVKNGDGNKAVEYLKKNTGKMKHFEAWKN